MYDISYVSFHALLVTFCIANNDPIRTISMPPFENGSLYGGA